MTTIEEMKKAILEMEKVAHEYEQLVKSADTSDDAELFEEIAGEYRIAAACCWEKLEHLEAGDGWFRPEKGELPPQGETVIAIVSGMPAYGVTLKGSYQMATYYGEEPEGWVIEEWPEWETPTVHCWQQPPEAPEEVRKIWAEIEAGTRK